MRLAECFDENEGLRCEWAEDLNEKTPSQLSTYSREKVWWRCGNGHTWQATPEGRAVRGRGCPHCRKNKIIPGETDLATKVPEAILLWDYEKNGDLSPHKISPGSRAKAWWRCEKGHSWQAQIYNVAFVGSRCPYCAGYKAIPGETDLVTLSPEIAGQWDYEKNGDIRPETVSASSHAKVWWKCELGHSWQAMPFSRTRARSAGCPYCTGRKVLKGFNDLETLKPDLADEWNQLLNGELTPVDVTLGSNKKVWWQCADGHVWQAYIYTRTKPNGTGCPVCSGAVKAKRITYLNKENVRMYG